MLVPVTKNMSQFRCLLLLIGISTSSGNGSMALAQQNASVENRTRLSAPANPTPDSVRTRVARPRSLTFTGSTDQRFYFFNDTRNNNGRRVPVGMYGLRAGFFCPSRQRRADGTWVSSKAGIGFYFVNQTLNRPGLLPNTSESITRRLRLVTVIFEPYLLRHKAVHISLPLELGYGHSRYERSNDPSAGNEVARGFFLPAGVGVSATYRFPKLRWFRAFDWFGFNVLTGYRFILKKDVPASQINYNGLYVSAGPSFVFDNFMADYKHWRNKRKKR